ncbi:T6SS phospholipase effector Tle1-like catalytic domain-containing protein [Chondromyces apiculatus]|uniref:T6SS Phospholipase effector Tle1-like catalytic domain-containing protein n=1 Tax=Chondromyces apiculatus DSM 436 TaxID=1192034 RepID=A0A017T532_9BACT|nr:DUF2235 domain-containing protein [Chondromyces apiculatus]EYF04383.1 Hypothetical protein CAP_4522 [Chondromyces apiculatus DSM 436]
MSAAERAIDNMTKAQAMPRIAPSGTAQCPVGRVRIGVFFDGTNNSMQRDGAVDPRNPGDAGNAATNVVKLFRVYKTEGTLLKPIYHHGVGTDSHAQEGQGSNDRAYDWRGNAFGGGGKARVDWGIQQLSDFYSNNNNHLAQEKQFDTYGFSRGAAIARDFVNNVRNRGIDNLQKRNGWKYRSVGEVVIREPAYERHQGIVPTFVGVFDTVASFGLGGLDIGNDLAGYDFFIDHTYVQRTVHMIAEDEIRGNFPVSSLFMDPGDKESWLPWRRRAYQEPQTYKATMVELFYPGAHSDVGGGYIITPAVEHEPERVVYRPGPRGVRMRVVIPEVPYEPPKQPELALIPLRDMHKASVRAEVPLSGLTVNVPGDLAGWYGEYDGYRNGQPYAIGKQFIQSFDGDEYRPMYYEQRGSLPAIVNLKLHYIHDSRWPHDKLLRRKQRTVLYMGPQPKAGS